jgi:NitT/TauT family transport system permease protein/taurine transport system permease protein
MSVAAPAASATETHGVRLAPATLRRLLVLLLLLLWEALPRAGIVPPLFLPPLSQTVAALVTDWPEYLHHLAVSLYAIGISMTAACGIGIGAGLLVGSIRPVRRIVQPLASGLYAIPIVILYPLFTAWFGIGPQSKIVFASIYGLLPCFLGTVAGVQTIDHQYLVVARSAGATRWQMTVRVLLPAAIPTVLSSLRIGGALVIVGIVVAEMLTSAEGIGYLISRYRTLIDSPHVFAGILVVVAMVFAFDFLVRLLERRTLHWRLSSRSGESTGVL